jgi:hypothetical protein
MEACIDSAIRFPVPWDMINKLCDDKAISANIADMCFVKFPPVIVDLCDNYA